MAYDFPNSPTEGQEYTPHGGPTWTFSNGSWRMVTGGEATGETVAWADITGKPATFSPTLPIAQSGVTNLVTDLSGKAPTLHTHAQADITGLIAALAGKEPSLPTDGTTSTYLRGDKTWQTISGLDQATADNRYVNLTGDTMTGPLLLPSGGSQSATNLNFGTAGTGFIGSTNTLSASIQSSMRWSISTSSITHTLPTLFPSGSAAATSINFGTAGTGLYGTGAVVATAIAGVNKMTLDGTTLTMAVPITLPADGVGTMQVVSKSYVDLKAPIASPAFTGTPTSTTPTAGANGTHIATTAFVQGEITAKAPLASPVFTGDPRAPTPATADNDTSIATTEFVKAQNYSNPDHITSSSADMHAGFNSGAPIRFVINDKADGTGNEILQVEDSSRVRLTKFDDSNASGPHFTLDRISASPADSDTLGVLYFGGRNTALTGIVYADIYASIDDAIAGDGYMYLRTSAAGVAGARLRLNKDHAHFYGKIGVGNTAVPTAGSATFYTTGTISIGSGAGFNTYYTTNWTALETGWMHGIINNKSTGTLVIYRSPTSISGGAVGSLVSMLTFDSASDMTGVGHFSTAGRFQSTSNGEFVGNGTWAILGTAASSTGTIYLRPNGYNSSTNQTSISTGGNMTVTGSISGAGLYAGTFSATGATSGTNISSGRVNNSTTTTTSYTQFAFYNTNGAVGSIVTNASATSYGTSSDEVLKDFIGPYDPLSAIEVIRADPVRAFTWKSDGSYAVGWGAQTSYNVSQDLAQPPPPRSPEEIAIEGAGTDPKEPGYIPWSMDQSKRTPYLWAALSWALDEIDALKARIEMLEVARNA